MNSIHLRKRLESDTLHLPELKPLIGKTVEITIREEPQGVLNSGPYDMFFALIGRNVVDPDALKRLRAASAI